jgi:hypothetical protein
MTTDVNRVPWAEEVRQNVCVSGYVYDVGTGLAARLDLLRGRLHDRSS